MSDVLVLLTAGFLLGPVLGLVDGAWLAPAMPILAPLGSSSSSSKAGLELRWDDVRRHGWGALSFSLLSWGSAVVAVYLVCVDALGRLPMLALMFAAAVGASFAARVLVGGAIGFLAGLAWSRALFHVTDRGHAYALTLGALLVEHAATEFLGGSGYLAALVFGLVVGNAGLLTRDGGVSALASLAERSRQHQGEVVFLLRSVYFVFLGLSLGRDVVSPASGLAMLLLVGAIAAARMLIVALTHRGDGETRLLLSGTMPRGMATMVLAATPLAMGIPDAAALVPLALLVVVGADVATTIGLYVYERRRAWSPAASAEPAPDL